MVRTIRVPSTSSDCLMLRNSAPRRKAAALAAVRMRALSAGSCSTRLASASVDVASLPAALKKRSRTWGIAGMCNDSTARKTGPGTPPTGPFRPNFTGLSIAGVQRI